MQKLNKAHNDSKLLGFPAVRKEKAPNTIGMINTGLAHPSNGTPV